MCMCVVSACVLSVCVCEYVHVRVCVCVRWGFIFHFVPTQFLIAIHV